MNYSDLKIAFALYEIYNINIFHYIYLMDNKEILVKTAKDWVRLDNEIRTLQHEINVRKNEKKGLSSVLMNIMKQNEIDGFDINDGQIAYVKKNIKKPISKKLLLNLLSDYYKGDETKANELNNFILENREETTKETILRKISK
jgi:hypothetical protein